MIIYLNGSINAGKSTVAALLAQELPQTVNIEVDHLRHFADCISLDEVIPFCIEDAALLARRWHGRGFNVVVTWPISDVDHAQFTQLIGDIPLFTFTLAPRLEVALTNRGGREPLDGWELSRIQVHYQNGIAAPSFGVVIDNSEQTPAQTVQSIRERLPDA